MDLGFRYLMGRDTLEGRARSAEVTPGRLQAGEVDVTGLCPEEREPHCDSASL